MKVFVKYPCTEESKKLLINNLATFKAKLLLKSIENLKIKDQSKDKVLETMLDILNDMPNGSVI